MLRGAGGALTWGAAAVTEGTGVALCFGAVTGCELVSGMGAGAVTVASWLCLASQRSTNAMASGEGDGVGTFTMMVEDAGAATGCALDIPAE